MNNPATLFLCIALVGFAILAFPPPSPTVTWIGRAAAVVGTGVFVVLTLFAGV